MRKLGIRLFSFILCSAGLAASAYASSISCSVGDGQHSQSNTGALSCSASLNLPQLQTVTNVVSVPLDATTNVDMFDVFSQSALEMITAAGTLGTLHGLASATSTNGPAFYNYTSDYLALDDQGHTIPDAHGDPTYLHFQATDNNPMGNLNLPPDSRSEWTDAIRVMNPGAAAGSMVQFSIAAPLSGSFTSTDCSSANALGLNFFFVNNAATVNGITFGTTPVAAVGSSINACDPSSNFSTSTMFSVPVGAFLFLDGSLRVRAGVGNFSNGLTTSAVADALSTGHGYLDVLTPGAFYVDQNGATNSFATPAASDPGPGATVPEPATLTLLALGLTGAAAAVRRRTGR